MTLVKQTDGTWKPNITKGYKEKIKELGFTEEQMDKFFQDSLDCGHPLCKVVNKWGGNWRHMALHQLAALSNWKECYEKRQRERELKEEQEILQKQKEEFEQNVYKENFEQIIIQKIDSHEKLSTKELEDFLWELGKKVDEIDGDSQRWTTLVSTIKEYNGRYFRIDWFRGNTECQENEWCGDPYEVFPHKKVVVVTEWLKEKILDK